MNKAMTANEVAVAEGALKGAGEMIKAGTLRVNGVVIKAIHKGNIDGIFPPGIRELVRRYLRGW